MSDFLLKILAAKAKYVRQQIPAIWSRPFFPHSSATD
jgi:hypothetical protein